MTKKLLLGVFVSIFLLALVSSLSINNVNLGNVNAGQTVTVNTQVTNNEQTNYSIIFSSEDISFSQTNISNNTIKGISANYTIPSESGFKTISVNYNYTNSTGSTKTGSFNVNMTIAIPSSLVITKLQELTLSQNGTVKVENTGLSTLKVLLSSTGNALVSLSNTSFTLGSGESIEVEVVALDFSNLQFGNNPITITAKSGSNIDSVAFDIAASFCPIGEVGKNLSIYGVDISNAGDGDDDEWKFFDTVTVEVEVKNVGKDDVDNVVVELALFDSNGNDVSGDLEFLNDDEEKIELGDLKDGDRETVTFEFKVPADFSAGDYKLALKAYSDDFLETEVCADKSKDLSNSLYESIKVEEESDEGRFIGFDNVELSSQELVCGESTTLSFEVFNIGEDNQDRVLVTLYNDALDIEETYEIKEDFDVGDSQEISFTLVIPENAKDGNYDLRLTADYDYRNGNYRQDLEEDFEVPIKLIGCSAVPTTKVASISAVSQDAKAGSELVIDATIRNLVDEEKTFLIDLKDYTSWSELVSISDRAITLGAGESQTITITLNVDKDAFAEESLTINAISDGETVSKEVPVYIASKSGFSLGGNSTIWLIGALNLVLIIIIIIIAVKLSRR